MTHDETNVTETVTLSASADIVQHIGERRHDPTLHAWLNDADAPGPTGPDDTSYEVALSELEDLVARVREDERGKTRGEYLALVAKDSLEVRVDALRDAVEAIKNEWVKSRSEVGDPPLRMQVVDAIEALGGER